MRRFLLLFMSFLMLSGSPSLAAQSTDIPKIDTDWMKKYQEAIIICDRENQSCHQSLAKVTSEPIQDSWGVLLTAAVLGALGGIVIEHQVNH